MIAVVVVDAVGLGRLFGLFLAFFPLGLVSLLGLAGLLALPASDVGFALEGVFQHLPVVDGGHVDCLGAVVVLSFVRFDSCQGHEAFGFVEVGDGFVLGDLLDQVVAVPKEPGGPWLGLFLGFDFFCRCFPLGLADGFGDAPAEGVVDVVGGDTGLAVVFLRPDQTVFLVIGEIQGGGLVGGLGFEVGLRVEALEDGVAQDVVFVVEVVIVLQSVMAHIGRASWWGLR